MFFIARVRLKLESPDKDGHGVGFVSICSWPVEADVSSSTHSTPSHCVNMESRQSETSGRHQRSHSVPPAMQHRFVLLLFLKWMNKSYQARNLIKQFF